MVCIVHGCTVNRRWMAKTIELKQYHIFIYRNVSMIENILLTSSALLTLHS